MTKFEIITPQTHPNDEVVGHYFASGGDGSIYYCDSYDPRIGYWMTDILSPVEEWDNDTGRSRRNVSDRAIGRTFHIIRLNEGGQSRPDGRYARTQLGEWSKHDVAIDQIDEHRLRLAEWLSKKALQGS